MMRLIVMVLLALVMMSSTALALDRDYKACVDSRSGQICVCGPCGDWVAVGQATYIDNSLWVTDPSLTSRLLTREFAINDRPARVAIVDGDGKWLMLESYTPTICYEYEACECYRDPCTCEMVRYCQTICEEVPIEPTVLVDNPEWCCEWGDTFYRDLTRPCGTFIRQEWLCTADEYVITSTAANCGTAGAGMFVNDKCRECGLTAMVICGWECDGKYKTKCRLITPKMRRHIMVMVNDYEPVL